MTDRELMQQAADKLSIAVSYPGLRFYHEDMRTVLTALRERLAQPQRTHWEGCEEVHPECRQQKPPVKTYCGGKPNYCTPEQEPVAWVDERVVEWLGDRKGKASAHCTTILSAAQCSEQPMPLYATPPRREWVGLTDKDIEDVWSDETLGRYALSYAIEAKLREKNA